MENGKKIGEGDIYHGKASAELVEIIETSDGPTGVYKIRATDEQARETLKQGMEQFLGHIKEVPASPKDREGRSFGFSGVKWNTPWEPTGPKRNWAQNPEVQQARVQSLKQQGKLN